MDNEHLRQTTIGSLATAVVTLTGFILYQQINPPRDDPFRGEQATELRRELESKILAHEKSCSNRMATIERRLDQMDQAERELWAVVSALPPDEFEDRVRRLEFWVIKQDNTYTVPD